jgi:lipoyl(octanoyl) transferase
LDNGVRAPLVAAWLGRVDYATAWAAQESVFRACMRGERGDALMLLEHPPTYTLGRRSTEDDLVYDQRARAARGIELFEVDRGGRATYHGPGQLVGYPIVALGDHYDVLAYLRRLEEALVRLSADLGVTTELDAKHTGVWVGDKKIGAIGVKVTRGITMHGFAYNVTTDLTMFEGIVPCGLSDRWVTSVEELTGVKHSLKEVSTIAAGHLADVFGRALVWTHPGGLRVGQQHDAVLGEQN